MNKIIKVLLVITVLFISSPALADTAVHLDIETNTGSIYNQGITATPCDSDNDPATPDIESAYCALVQSGIPSDWSGLWVNSINGIVNNDNGNGAYWMWLVNLNINNATYGSCDQDNPYSCSAKQYILKPNDHIIFYYNTNPLNISVSNLNPAVGDNLTITVIELGLDSSWNPVWAPSSGATATLGTQSCTTIADGTCSIVLETAGSLNAVGSKILYAPSASASIEVSTPKPIGGSASCCSISGGSGGALSAIISSSSTPPSIPIIKTKFDLKKAFDFLILQQKENGSFGEDIYTDWVALALVSGNYQDQTIKLIKYFGEYKLENPTLTDYERHAMALMSLGLNPYNIYSASDETSGENYIGKITAGFDGKQFGNINEDNDDIFALIVLQNAGYKQDEKMITDDITFILNKQKDNGSWDESVDMTGASIEALSAFSQNEQVKNALIKAKEFLKQNQKENGGWGNASSTAWAIEGILALSEKPTNIAIGDTPEYFDLQNIFREDWIKNGNTPLDYFAIIQDTDGGTKNENIQNKIWETAYVTSALSGKTWNQIMQKFEKPKEVITKEKENRLLEEKLEKILALLEDRKIKEEEKSKPAVVKITAKKPAQSIEIAKNPKKGEKEDEPPKLENLASQNISQSMSQNTATALTAITDSPAQKTETPQRNWFLRFLDKIFSIF